MPSPDISPYVDVTLYDLTVEQIADEALTYAQTVLPEFDPEVGSYEDAMIQAFALMTAKLAGKMNRMTAGAVEVILQLLGITRQSGSPATGTATVSVLDNLGYSIPVGTKFGYWDRSDPAVPVLYTFESSDSIDVPQGSTSASVPLRAILNTRYPPLAAGQMLQLMTPVAFIQTVVLSAPLAVGAEPETDAQFFSRAIATLNSYSAALVIPSQFEQYVLKTYSDVYRCKAYSRVNPANGSDVIDPPENGYLTVYAARVGGASLTPTVSASIEEDLTDRGVAGLIINVEPPFLVTVPISITVVGKQGYLSSTVAANITAAINQSIHPDHWLWETKIYYNELISLIDRVDGVERVSSLTLNGTTTDYSFTKYGSLPTASLSVSVT